MMGKSELDIDIRYRLSIVSRVLAASVGGYALVSALAVLLALPLAAYWPMPLQQAVMVTAFFGFLIYVPIVLWVFHTPSAARAWVWLAAWSVMVSLLGWWLLKGGTA